MNGFVLGFEFNIQIEWMIRRWRDAMALDASCSMYDTPRRPAYKYQIKSENPAKRLPDYNRFTFLFHGPTIFSMRVCLTLFKLSTVIKRIENANLAPTHVESAARAVG